MAQQRIKFVRGQDGGYVPATEADSNTLTAQPVALDANEDFRLIVRDDIPLAQLADSIQALVTTIRDGQLLTGAVVQ